jgi:hypothetical protein
MSSFSMIGSGFRAASALDDQPAAAASGFGDLQSFGTGLAIAGVATEAIGAFYAIDAQKYQLRSQALSAEFAENIARINARAAEFDAHLALEAGRRRRALSTLRSGQVRGAQRVSAAARGVQAGVGSAGEIMASVELAKDVDAFAIDAQAFREASIARRRATGELTRADLARVSATNLRGTADALNPFLAAGSTILGGSGRLALQFGQNERRRLRFGRS